MRPLRVLVVAAAAAVANAAVWSEEESAWVRVPKTVQVPESEAAYGIPALDAVVGALNAAGATLPPAPVATAVILSGYLRTGAIPVIRDAWRDRVLAPLGGCDLFWLASESALRVSELAPPLLASWSGIVRYVRVAGANRDVFDAVERNCSAVAGAGAREPPQRNCLPARAQFFNTAAAFALVRAREAALKAQYAWVLKIRGDMVPSAPLPGVGTWVKAPAAAAYFDGVFYHAACSHGRSPCGCLCVGDRYVIAHRSHAAAVFEAAARFLGARGCAADERCPSLDGDACYPSPAVRLFPECLLGEALRSAGLVDGTTIRGLASGPIFSCGPANESLAAAHRSNDDSPCGAPYWRSSSGRTELQKSLAARPLPPPKSAKPFWEGKWQDRKAVLVP